jgi:hypothetical protein
VIWCSAVRVEFSAISGLEDWSLGESGLSFLVKQGAILWTRGVRSVGGVHRLWHVFWVAQLCSGCCGYVWCGAFSRNWIKKKKSSEGVFWVNRRVGFRWVPLSSMRSADSCSPFCCGVIPQ